MKNLIFLTLLLPAVLSAGQVFQPKWESLDKRPTPAWFEDSKFGIFIHWGVYSVPAWGPTDAGIDVYDRYAEWYWGKLMDKKSLVNSLFVDHHLTTYGPNFKYQDFAPMFKAELFDPGQWAELFRDAGARYVILTSKHHEGYPLWPSAQSWNWNSMDTGPNRDLCGELTAAVKAQCLRMGFYYSLYEWFNPLYRDDFAGYVDNHMIPQLKDLVTRYEPDIVWADGEWDRPSRDWKSEEYLAWLFNESPVKDRVVVNDRWGSETRGRHGSLYTTEYGRVGDKEGVVPEVKHPWEECRGIGTSFGYNRAENLDSYSTSKELIRLLVSTVAAGGNLLLDIGPAADGTIPVIMQQRLTDMGEWLKVNGEAIYGTRAFLRDKDDRSFHPETNKSVFFTRKNGDLYVICTDWPDGDVVIRGLNVSRVPEVRLLGSPKAVEARISADGLTIALPALGPDDHQPAYVFRIGNILK